MNMVFFNNIVRFIRIRFIRLKITSPSKETIRIFGIFSFINYLFLYFNSDYLLLEQHGNIYRIIAAILAILLVLYEIWPTKLQNFLEPFWYITICYSIPFFGTYMLLENPSSVTWQANNIIGLFWFGLITDWVAFILLMPISVLVGIIYYKILHGTINVTFDNFQGMFGHYVFAVIVALVFSRNKELFLKSHQLKKLNKLNAKLSVQSKRLEEALTSKTEFLNNISHEIRTPIHGVSNISEGLVQQWNNFTNKKRFNLAKQVAESAARLYILVGDILDVSKYFQGKMLMHFRNVDIIKATEEIIKHTNRENINITVNTDNNIIIADGERVGQIIRNILNNAIKFSPSGSVINVEIFDSIITDNHSKKCAALHFLIEDLGVGIPKEEVDSLFIPFFQSSRTKTKAGGTGLGLAICKEIIEAHRGKIWVENNKDQPGTSFNFLLPLTQIKELANKIVDIDERAKLVLQQNPKQDITILIIDDESICHTSMMLLLANTSYKLLTAISGKEGLEILSRSSIDVILLDLMMPDIYGLNVLQEIKKDPKLSNIPVILQSGTSDETEIKRAFELGASAYIRKPYQRSEVIDAINEVNQYL